MPSSVFECLWDTLGEVENSHALRLYFAVNLDRCRKGVYMLKSDLRKEFLSLALPSSHHINRGIANDDAIARLALHIKSAETLHNSTESCRCISRLYTLRALSSTAPIPAE